MDNEEVKVLLKRIKVELEGIFLLLLLIAIQNCLGCGHKVSG